MFSKIANREEEIDLLAFVINEAKANKELIASLEAFEVETKANGTLHKGKETIRLALIKRLKKENKQYKEFYMKRNKIDETGTFDYHMYQFRKEVSEKRKHLKRKDNK